MRRGMTCSSTADLPNFAASLIALNYRNKQKIPGREIMRADAPAHFRSSASQPGERSISVARGLSIRKSLWDHTESRESPDQLQDLFRIRAEAPPPGPPPAFMRSCSLHSSAADSVTAIAASMLPPSVGRSRLARWLPPAAGCGAAEEGERDPRLSVVVVEGIELFRVRSQNDSARATVSR